ncbi:hypothetical protein YT1_1732 [Rhodococcus ruber]|nr:hypothetical protein YT1_1732 [Rhodococcus ruber]
MGDGHVISWVGGTRAGEPAKSVEREQMLMGAFICSVR